VMHAVGFDGAQRLEVTDLSALSARHRLRWTDNGERRVSVDFPASIAVEQMLSPISFRRAPRPELYRNRTATIA
jgi:hypothetical protein